MEIKDTKTVQELMTHLAAVCGVAAPDGQDIEPTEQNLVLLLRAATYDVVYFGDYGNRPQRYLGSRRIEAATLHEAHEDFLRFSAFVDRDDV